MIEVFCKNSWRLLSRQLFSKKAPSIKFNRVLNTPLQIQKWLKPSTIFTKNTLSYMFDRVLNAGHPHQDTLTFNLYNHAYFKLKKKESSLRIFFKYSYSSLKLSCGCHGFWKLQRVTLISFFERNMSGNLLEKCILNKMLFTFQLIWRGCWRLFLTVLTLERANLILINVIPDSCYLIQMSLEPY